MDIGSVPVVLGNDVDGLESVESAADSISAPRGRRCTGRCTPRLLLSPLVLPRMVCHGRSVAMMNTMCVHLACDAGSWQAGYSKTGRTRSGSGVGKVGAHRFSSSCGAARKIELVDGY